MRLGHRMVGLLLIGGHHHILHLIPIASELSKFERIQVIIFVMTEAEKELCGEVLI